MKPSKIRILLHHYVKIGKPVMIWGKPGIGKTELVYAVAKEYAMSIAHVELDRQKLADMPAEAFAKVIILALKNPVHLSGLPDLQSTREGKRTVYTMPDVMIEDHEPYVILFLDEINTAAPSVQAAAYSLVHERRIGEYRLPDHIRVIAAGNRKSDRAAAVDMSTAMRNRFMHIDFEYDNNDWIEWAVENHVDDVVIAWAHWNSHLMALSPGDTVNIAGTQVKFNADANAYPTPRSMKALADSMPYPAEVEDEGIMSCIGREVGSQFLAFMQTFRQMETPKNILANPTTARVPDKIGTRWLVATTLTNFADASTIEAILQYLERFTNANGMMEKEYTMFFLRLAGKKNEDVKQTSAYARALAKYAEIEIN